MVNGASCGFQMETNRSNVEGSYPITNYSFCQHARSSAPILPQVGMLRTSVRSRMVSRVIRRRDRQTHMGIVGFLVLRPGRRTIAKEIRSLEVLM